MLTHPLCLSHSLIPSWCAFHVYLFSTCDPTPACAVAPSQARFALGRMLRDAGVEEAAAVEVYEGILNDPALAPSTRARALIELGEALYAARRPADARASLQLAASVQPELADAHTARAALALKDNNPADAAEGG